MGTIDGRFMPNTNPGLSPDSNMSSIGEGSMATDFFELWDYVGGARFRGFVAERDGQRSVFVFFDREALGHDLKNSLMALLELCNVAQIDASELVICMDRHLRTGESRTLMRDLGYVGFQPTTLAHWSAYGDIVSDRWTFLSMEI